MAWVDDDVPSGRSRDDLLSGVVKRGHLLALRRRLVTAGVSLAAMVLVLPAGVLAVRDDGDTTQVASEAPASTSTSAPVTTLVSGTEGVAAENPAADPPPATSSSVPPTTLKAPVTTARTVPASTTSTPVGSLPRCATAKLAAGAQSGQAVYQWDETVTATGFVSNDSRTACRYTSYTLRFEVRQGATTVFSAASVLDTFKDTALGVGQVLVAAPADWSRRTCNGSELCPSGDYVAVFSWSFDGGPAVEARAPFLVTPAPTTTTSTPPE
ncbi:MAG: hypothetical protein ACRD0Q_12505 [Acidimicrobiales bacterium]